MIAQALEDPPHAGRRLFLGHSMGATLAYEVALCLAGWPGGPSGRFVSGCPAPSRRGGNSFKGLVALGPLFRPHCVPHSGAARAVASTRQPALL
ncbi:thioesterase domain-containing protein [Streptomyces sp. MMG1121]|uniref:thioesterase domain-containing protein n=1 Tax=Streptomyces sp. MMG1121 TaxID=1415544 RepID=UPI002D21E4FB|nr:thioesterase domain-containing protein [Streptomyces sp. MMG1121]